MPPVLKGDPGWKGAPVDGGGGGSDNDPMEHRVTVLETRLDTILPTLATKHDVADAKGDIVKWLVGTALAISVAAVTIISFVLNNAAPKSPAPPSVVIYSTPSGQVAPAVPASQGK